MKKVIGALVIGLVVAGIWVHSKATYSPPNGNELEILLQLAGIFPSDYRVNWHQQGTLRSTDADEIRDPSLLRRALFTHNVATASSRSEGVVYVEAAYRFLASERKMESHDEFLQDRLSSAGMKSLLIKRPMGDVARRKRPITL